MIPFERVAECIRKLQAIVDVESNSLKKRTYKDLLEGLKLAYDSIVKDNIPCPPEMEESVGKSLKVIEDLYARIACN
jgi:hypothetical protein